MYNEQEIVVFDQTLWHTIEDTYGRKKNKDKVEEAFSNPEIITRAMVQGVREALLKHKQAGNQLLYGRTGRSSG